MRMYECIYIYTYRPLRGGGSISTGPKSPGEQTRVLRTYDFRGDVAAWKKMMCRLLVRPIPMRKANPAFCDRSKSHKKLDPFDDRKMVHWLAENPFLVRSSTISVRVPIHHIMPMTVRVCVHAPPICFWDSCASSVCARACLCYRCSIMRVARLDR